jgi:hypothetical protein
MQFYWRELGIISQVRMLSALATRMSALARLSNYDDLDGRPLLGKDGEPARFPESVWESHSIVAELSAFGKIISIGGGDFFFYGLRANLLNLMINQSHDKIRLYVNEYADEPSTYSVDGRVSEEIILLADKDPKDFRKPKGTSRYYVPFEGELWQTSAGRVFGSVQISR